MNDLNVNLYKSVKGKILTTVRGLVYVSADNKYDLNNPYDVVFLFDNNQNDRLTFSCNSDHETMDVTDKNIHSFDMQDCGRAEIVDLSNTEPYIFAIRKRLSKIFILISGIDQKNIGCSLLFDQTELSFLNLGGELFSFNRICESLIKDEEIIYKELLDD